MGLISGIGKKGAGEDIAWPEVIFLVLLLAFMAVFFIFVKNNLNGSFVQEEIYAKKIALLIDSAKPNTTIYLDVSELNDLAIKSGEHKEYYREIIKLDVEKHMVTVSLRLGNQSFSYPYFSEYSVSDNWDLHPDSEGKQKLNYILVVTPNEQ